MIIDKFTFLDVIEKLKQNVIQDTTTTGGLTYKRIDENDYEVEGIVTIQEDGKTGAIYLPKENGQSIHN